MLAYALFKQAIREEASSGLAPQSNKRNPSATTVKTYKAAAEQLITDVVGRAIDAATPELQRSAILTAIEGSQSEIKSHVTERTSFGAALLTNVLAWVLTLAIAALILYIAARPNIEQVVAQAAIEETDAVAEKTQ